MAYIEKCTGEGCNVKESCRRYTEKDNPQKQPYFKVSPIEDGRCEMYWGTSQQNILDQLKDITNGI